MNPPVKFSFPRARRMAGVLVSLLVSQVAFALGETIFAPPLHPTVIMSEYKKAFLPVVSVTGQDPQIQFEGKLKRLPSAPRFIPLRGQSFAPGAIKIKKLQASSGKTNLVYMFSGGGEVNGGTIEAHSDFEATIISSEARTHCYVAVLFFDSGFTSGETDKASAAVVFQDIGDLVAGREKKVDVRFGYLDNANTRLTYFPLFFSGGVEIRTDLSDQSAVFFRRMELITHERLVKNYREKNQGQNHKAEAYLKIPLFVPPDYPREKLPRSVDTSFMVAEDGGVEGLQIETQLDPELRRAVQRAIGGWLFLPRLHEGRPARTLVRLPIGFDDAKPVKDVTGGRDE